MTLFEDSAQASVPPCPHAAHLVFRCLDLSKDPNWSSCVHPETHLATRDWRHRCRSPPCSPCFLHIKNLLVDVLDLFFIPCAPRGFVKNSSNCAVIGPQVPLQVSGHFLLSRRLQSRDRKPRVHDSTAPVLCLAGADTAHRKHPEASQETRDG